MLKIGIVGISGRMGHAIYEACVGLEGVKVVLGIDRNTEGAPIGFSAPLVSSVKEITQDPDIFIDFTRPACSLEILEYAKEHNIRVILGTTGFTEEQKAQITKASKQIPIVMAANFSVGVNVLLDLVKKAAAIMADADIEIVEAHHRYKVDAPSGTALAMGEAAAAGRNVNLADVMVQGRQGITGERQYGTIGFSSIRGGDIVGDHSAMFCCDGEIVEISHHASSRANFARGAMRAALWLEDKKPGFYSMREVLGL